MANQRIGIDIFAFDHASSVFRSVTGSVRSFAAGTNNAITQFNATLRGYNNAMRGFNNITRRVLLEASKAVYDFTTDAIKNFAELERQHAKTMGAMAQDYTKTAEAQAKFIADGEALKQQAIRLGTVGPTGRGTLYDVQSVSSAQTALVKAGVKPKDIVDTDAITNILKFAGGNDLGIETATNFAVQLGTQFKIPMQEWGAMLDKVTYAADISIIDVEDIIESLKIGGGVPSSINRPLEEVLAMLSTMGNAGLKGSMAGTGVQAIYSRGMSPSGISTAGVAPTQNIQDLYKGFVGKVADKDGMFLGMQNFTEELEEIMSSVSDTEKVWFAKKLFGMFQQKAAFALGRTDADGELVFEQMQDAITNMSGGTIDAKWELMLGSMFGNIEALKNAYEGIKTDIGGRLQPAVREVTTQAFNWLTDPNNFEFDFTKLREAIYTSGDTISEAYGVQIGEFVKNLGDFGINTFQIGKAVVPEVGSIGNATMLLFAGKPEEAWAALTEGLVETNEEIEKLPPELRDMAKGVRNAIYALAILVGANFVSQILESFTTIWRYTGGKILETFTGKVSGVSNIKSGTSNINSPVVHMNATGSVSLITNGIVTIPNMTGTVSAFNATAAKVDIVATIVNVYGSKINDFRQGGNGGSGGGGALPSGGGGPLLLPGGGAATPLLPSGGGGGQLLLPGAAAAGAGGAAMYGAAKTGAINLFRNPFTGTYMTAGSMVKNFLGKGAMIAAILANAKMMTSPGLFEGADSRARGGSGNIDSWIAGANDASVDDLMSQHGSDAYAYYWAQQHSQYNGENSQELIRREIEGRLLARDEMMRIYKSAEGADYLRQLFDQQYAAGGKLDESFLTELLTFTGSSGYTYTGSNDDMKAILENMYANFDSYSDGWNYSGRFNDSKINDFVKDNENFADTASMESLITETSAAMTANNEVLNQIAAAIAGWVSENIITIQQPQPNIDLQVQVQVDKDGNVTSQSVIPNYSGYDDYVYRQTQRFGGANE